MRIHNSDFGRRSPGGGCVLCREYVPSRHIRSSGWALSLWLFNSASFMCDSGPVVEFWLLHTVAVGSISSGGDYGVHCWWDPIRSKQLFSVLYVTCGCLPDFLVIIILIYIYIYIYKLINWTNELTSQNWCNTVTHITPLWKTFL